MDPQGNLYRGEKQSPWDVELTEEQFHELSRISQEERKNRYPELFGAAKRKRQRRKEIR